uniref:Uncharacterized protein n=1 Tax=Anguilla anguilla TaxID=7936 RepID=A0A0E9TBF2_ANGAN
MQPLTPTPMPLRNSGSSTTRDGAGGHQPSPTPLTYLVLEP